MSTATASPEKIEVSKDDFKFIGSEKNISAFNIECPICLMVIMDKPCKTSCCKKNFCRACISRITGDCPMCRKKYMNYTADRRFRRIVYSQKMQCMKKKPQGAECGWKGELGSLTHHLKSCDYVIVQCSHCDLKDTLLRIDLKDHLENHCPMHPVKCPFSWLGCEERPLRKDVEKHYSDTKHATLFEAAYQKLCSDATNLRMANNHLTSCLNRHRSHESRLAADMRFNYLENELQTLKWEHEELKNRHDNLKIIIIVVIVAVLAVAICITNYYH
ncbi:PREDICTED: TNF receptor-associated factor 6-like [Amphimedon queenslandica]|uniref:RING-type domain-containing protein n=1 Tax=Amphimedon queenslandica TaxID=400682 RepID=A0A1X7ULS9_AMPQE|nr:PREDICTED: TNF receptor-associated factor 6-like [Amphimedon queenslandica]|eukprot:XP_011404661.1 PREDICTED: TNF receptor-associated factor 6-like [Amphimedon queenslandica]